MNNTTTNNYSELMDKTRSHLITEAIRCGSRIFMSFHSSDRPKENLFEYTRNQFSDPNKSAGKYCKTYIEYAEKCGRVDEAKKEIERLLSKAAKNTKVGISNMDVTNAVECIMALYTTQAENHRTSNIQQFPDEDEMIKNLLGEKVHDFIIKLRSTSSEEEALKLIESANSDDLNINLKDLLKVMVANTTGQLAGSANSTAEPEAKSQQPNPKSKQTKQVSSQKKTSTSNTKQQKKSTTTANTTEPDMAQMILQAEPGQKLFTTTSEPQPQTV